MPEQIKNMKLIVDGLKMGGTYARRKRRYELRGRSIS